MIVTTMSGFSLFSGSTAGVKSLAARSSTRDVNFTSGATRASVFFIASAWPVP